jgi:hypothetical protein
MTQGEQGAAAGLSMAWKMTGQREILQPVIDAYHRGEIPDDEAELIADIAGLDPRQRGLIASKSDHLFSAAAKYTPEQQRLSGGGITGRKDGNFPTWVWRTKPDSDVIQNPDGSVSSHKMRHEVTEDGTWITFPQIQRDESGQLKDYGDEAMDRVLESGNYFKYPDEKSAAAYSMGSWKQPGREPGTGDEGLIARLTKGMGDGKPAPRPDTMEFREGVDSPGRRDTMEFREGIDNPGTRIPMLQTETPDFSKNRGTPAMRKEEPRFEPSQAKPAARLETPKKKSGVINTDVIHGIESNFGDPKFMLSDKGAKGHYGFMPGTWEQVREELGHAGDDSWSFENGTMDKDKSEEASNYYFNEVIPRELRNYGVPVTEKTILAAYNYGSKNVKKKYEEHGAKWWEGHLPKETRNYIKKYEKRKKNG